MNAAFVVDVINGDVKLFLCDGDHAINVCNRVETVTLDILNNGDRYKIVSYCGADTVADIVCNYMPNSVRDNICAYIRRMYSIDIDKKVSEAVDAYKRMIEVAQTLHDIPMLLRDNEDYQIVYGKHDGCDKTYRWINIVSSDDKRVDVSDRITVITSSGIKDDVTVTKVVDTSVLPYPDKLSFVVCKN